MDLILRGANLADGRREQDIGIEAGRTPIAIGQLQKGFWQFAATSMCAIRGCSQSRPCLR